MLDNLVAKISQKSLEAQKAVMEEAKAKKDQIVAQRKSDAESQRSAILESAANEAKTMKAQLVAGKRLEHRNKRLAAKQQMIERVFALATSKMENMAESEYLDFVEKTLKAAGLTEGTLVVPEKFKGIDTTALSQKLGQTVSIDKNRTVKNGFIFVRAGVEYNNTFDSLLQFNRDDLELLVSEALF